MNRRYQNILQCGTEIVFPSDVTNNCSIFKPNQVIAWVVRFEFKVTFKIMISILYS